MRKTKWPAMVYRLSKPFKSIKSRYIYIYKYCTKKWIHHNELPTKTEKTFLGIFFQESKFRHVSNHRHWEHLLEMLGMHSEREREKKNMSVEAECCGERASFSSWRLGQKEMRKAKHTELARINQGEGSTGCDSRHLLWLVSKCTKWGRSEK